MKKRLQDKLEQVASVVREFDFADVRTHAHWLAQTYYFVRHSTPMLALSCGLSVENRDYHNRCIEHLAEEKGHDKMILNDLKFLGFKVSDFPELASTQALYQTQYYWIEHKSPMSFLGYITLLEGLSIYCGEIALKKAQALKGLSFLKLHAEEDSSHLDKAFKMIESLPSDEQERIIANFELSAHLYIQMINQVTEQNCAVAA
jgi:hypothetical protein